MPENENNRGTFWNTTKNRDLMFFFSLWSFESSLEAYGAHRIHFLPTRFILRVAPINIHPEPLRMWWSFRPVHNNSVGHTVYPQNKFCSHCITVCCSATSGINETFWSLNSTKCLFSALTCLVNKFVLNLPINRVLFILIFVYGSHLTNNFAVAGIYALKSRKVNK